MSAWWMALAIVALALAVGICIAWRPVRARLRAKELARLRRNFHRQREYLEARFLTIAADSGKPRGLEWVRCDFEDDVIYARNRQSGELTAFVGVTIGFEAVEGGGMEDVAAVGNLRAATAVFRVERGNWATDGRALFNLNPAEAVAYYQENLELVGQELAHHR
ncbi:MAG TPA: hypothetical protein VL175_16675 [Pirellulales bacterium]|nr:hypothetical protein [Pirellulales bacterium]